MRLFLVAMTWSYLVILGAWAFAWALVGDRSALLFAISSLALYLFLPLPLAPLIALLTRARSLVLPLVAAVALWAFLWGPLFLPNATPQDATGPRLTVMTYNVLVANPDAAAVVRTIRESGADIVSLQELSPAMAAALVRDLGDEYPYRGLRPGAGLVSRLPFRELEQPISPPDPRLIFAELEVDGRRVTVVRFHMASGPSRWRQRSLQAQILADYARGHAGPLILAGDLNATSTNDAYQVMKDAVHDSWLEAGHGFGHTFPGVSRQIVPGSSRPRLLGLDLPQWLIRIDYVFHSSHWKAIAARTAPFDGGSDHRGVIVTLALKD